MDRLRESQGDTDAGRGRYGMQQGFSGRKPRTRIGSSIRSYSVPTNTRIALSGSWTARRT